LKIYFKLSKSDGAPKVCVRSTQNSKTVFVNPRLHFAKLP